MTTPGRYAAADGTFAKSAGSAAARGGVLIAIAVVLGMIILAVGYDGGDDSAAIDGTSDDDTTVPDDGTSDDDTTVPDDGTSDDDTTVPDDDTSDDDTDLPGTTDPPVTTPPAVHPPGEVKVVVANGVGEPGIAGITAGVLSTAGYVAEPTNTVAKPQTVSMILWVEGYAADATAVAEAIGAPASVIDQAPPDPGALVTATTVDDFHIWVIQGDDRLAG